MKPKAASAPECTTVLWRHSRQTLLSALLVSTLLVFGVPTFLERHSGRSRRQQWAVAARLLQQDSAGQFPQLTYFGIEPLDKALGCPIASHACFYSFTADRVPVPHQAGVHRTSDAACTLVVRNCNRHGECIKLRDWCIIRRDLPEWVLTEVSSGPWHHETRSTYLFSRQDLPNPTHLAVLHYLPLFRWMEQTHIPPGQVLMIWDDAKTGGPGQYGLGLAAALGETRWLPEMQGPITFRHIRLGEHGDLRFPYHLLKHELNLAEDTAFQRLAAAVKQNLGLPGSNFASRPRVVIARRDTKHTRVMASANELLAAVLAAGMEAELVDFAQLSFEQQVRVMHDAAVLVSVHGADCMNLMWLPARAAMLEIVPVHYGYGYRKVLRKGDYFNLARLLGKRHMEYISPRNATILRTANGHLVDWNHVNFVGEVPIDVQTLLPLVKAAVLMACGDCYEACGPMDAQGRVHCLPDDIAQDLSRL